MSSPWSGKDDGGNVTSPDKRARQKERRAAIVAAQNAANRRRVAFRVGLAVLGLGAIIGMALFAGGGDDDGDDGAGGGPAACGAKAPPEPTDTQYPGPPEMALDDGVDYAAVISTSCGDIELDLLEEDAPINVNNFVFLAREGFYDGRVWHRVEINQVIQAGSFDGTGQGGPGYEIQDELPKSAKEYVYGTVAMANSGPNSAGSQFFVAVKDPDPKGGFESAGYPPGYSIFGKIDPADAASVETLTEISTQPVGGPQGTTPNTPIYIESIEITES